MDQAHLKDTIQKLESLRQKQNAEIDELIISLHTQATIDTGRAGMTPGPDPSLTSERRSANPQYRKVLVQ